MLEVRFRLLRACSALTVVQEYPKRHVWELCQEGQSMAGKELVAVCQDAGVDHVQLLFSVDCGDVRCTQVFRACCAHKGLLEWPKSGAARVVEIVQLCGTPCVACRQTRGRSPWQCRKQQPHGATGPSGLGCTYRQQQHGHWQLQRKNRHRWMGLGSQHRAATVYVKADRYGRLGHYRVGSRARAGKQHSTTDTVRSASPPARHAASSLLPTLTVSSASEEHEHDHGQAISPSPSSSSASSPSRSPCMSPSPASSPLSLGPTTGASTNHTISPESPRSRRLRKPPPVSNSSPSSRAMVTICEDQTIEYVDDNLDSPQLRRASRASHALQSKVTNLWQLRQAIAVLREQWERSEPSTFCWSTSLESLMQGALSPALLELGFDPLLVAESTPDDSDPVVVKRVLGYLRDTLSVLDCAAIAQAVCDVPTKPLSTAPEQLDMDLVALKLQRLLDTETHSKAIPLRRELLPNSSFYEDGEDDSHDDQQGTP
eukprot:m.71554 g.71554  ORF g.71554 m.71554 type:complete len:486 (-) comp14191_c0_seq2:41-1498(-)